MRIYNMKCNHELCGRVFDWHTKSAIYEVCKKDNFREVRCWFCGRLGAQRAWTHATPDLTVKGTWGKHASPELRGKDYYGKEQQKAQAAAVGSTMVDHGEDRGKRVPVARDKTTIRDEAREVITNLLLEHGELRLAEIVKKSGLKDYVVHDVIYKDPGRIHKVDRGVYALTGVSSQSASAST